MSERPLPPRVVANWYLEQCLGAGYSGAIYRARHLHTNQVVALKVQPRDHECPTNQYERHVYPSLQAGKGMPTYWAGGLEGEWDYIAIDLLGASLDSINRKAGGPAVVMDLGTVCCIAMQMIERLQLMHARGILHRDIQLGNAVIGLAPNQHLIYMIDFGFSKRYIDPYTRRHIPDSKAKRDFIGNYWFSSVNVHCRGKVPSRRDDLEACALMLIHLLTPRGLAWTRDGVPKTDAAHNRLKQQKRNATPEDLCRGLPVEFEEFLRYCRRLKFAEQPDYARWIDEFRELKVELGYDDSDAFVWPAPQPKSTEKPVVTNYNRGRTPGIVATDDLDGILNGLATLNFNQARETRPVLGHRQNLELVKPNSSAEGQKNAKQIIEISSGSETSNDEGLKKSPAFVETKARRIQKLIQRVSQATDNATLSELVSEFTDAMQCNSSRTLTREASMFLDALCKQLEDPSVFFVRTSRLRSVDKSVQKDPVRVKLGVVARLRREVSHAPSNKALAAMVEEFSKVTNKSTGRTITKDGFAFLEGIGEKLTSLR